MQELEPRHYSRFLSEQTHVRKSPLKRQASIAGVRVANDLRSLRPVLEKWINLNAELAERWRVDVPWWYNERALLGLFSSAVWLSGGVALEEYTVSKRTLTKHGHVDGDSFTGRADLYFETPKGDCFRAEVKQCWLRTSSMKDQRLKLKHCLHRVNRDIHQAEPEDNTQRLAVVFITPSVSFKKTGQIADHIQWAIEQVRSFRHDSLAWVFPEPGSYGKATQYTHPGVIMLIKQARR